MHRLIFLFCNLPFLNKIPAIKPIMPKLNICHGVQGPCAKKKFDTKPVIAPTKNPASAPKQTADIITIATTGLNCGNIKNAARPATPIADSTAIIISSLACGFLSSNTIKNGNIVHTIIPRLTM